MNESLKENLRRKSNYIDNVQIHEGVPLFSWIDINITELCNRKCEFCPRIDDVIYPNQNLNMDIKLAQKISNELKNLKYKGVVVFSGYSEPTLHPNLIEIISAFKDSARLELVTNGDKLTKNNISELSIAGINHFVVSMYDGPHQVKFFENLFNEAGIENNNVTLRDRWHSEEDGFGIKLTNRAGTINVGKQEIVDNAKKCFYTAYSMTVDWNGDVLLCMQDWHKKVKFGNLNVVSLMDAWKTTHFNRYRNGLIKGKRDKFSPCNLCNTDGTLHGENHVKFWEKL